MTLCWPLANREDTQIYWNSYKNISDIGSISFLQNSQTIVKNYLFLVNSLRPSDVMATGILVNIGSGNGLLHNGAKPLP